MLKGGHVIFAFVIYFLGVDWKPKHITLGLFDAKYTTG